MGDIDVMIHPEDAARAQEIAAGNGWAVSASIDEEAFSAVDHQHLAPMVDGSGLGLGLDLHTRFSASYEPAGFDAESVWSRSVAFPSRSTAGASHHRGATSAPPGRPGYPSLIARQPDPVDLLLHVCIHFAWSHTLSAGMWKAFRDVEVLSHHPGLEADTFAERVERVGCGSLVFWTFRMSEALGGVQLPDALRNAVETPVPSGAVEPLIRHFASGMLTVESGRPPVHLSRMLWECAIRPRQLGAGEVRPWSAHEKFEAVKPTDTDSHPLEGGSGKRKARLWRTIAQVVDSIRHLARIVRGR
jgi:hypothetical protein